MRDLSFSLLVGAAWFLASSTPLLSQSIMHLTGPGGYGAASPTYLIRQTFNGTGYDNSESWTESNNPNEDWDTAPAPLEGDDSWYSNSGTEASNSPTFSAPATTYVYFRFNYSAAPSANTEIFKLVNSTEVASIQLRTSGLMRMEHGTNITNLLTPSTATTYHFWIDYTPGSGANGAMNFYYATTATKPGSPDYSTVAGTSTVQSNQVQIGGGTGSGVIIDVLLVDDVNIGSNPSF